MDRIEIESILKDLEDTVSGASRIPLTGKVLIDGDLVLEFVDKIHAVLPEELKQARNVLNQSDKLLESMESQGKRILDEARSQARILVQENQIVLDAQALAQEIQEKAEAAAMELRQEALTYSEDILHQLETNLEKAIFSIKRSRDEIKSFRMPVGGNGNYNSNNMD